MTRITRDNFEKAVINTGGVKSSIAKRLKVSRSAITKYCDRNPWTEEVLNEEIEAINDLAENKLFELIVDKDYKAIKLRLTTKARVEVMLKGKKLLRVLRVIWMQIV